MSSGIENLEHALSAVFGLDRVHVDVPLRPFTTFKVAQGGNSSAEKPLRVFW